MSFTQSGGVAADNIHFHSPVSLDVPFQIADIRRVQVTETREAEHWRESTVLISLMIEVYIL